MSETSDGETVEGPVGRWVDATQKRRAVTLLAALLVPEAVCKEAPIECRGQFYSVNGQIPPMACVMQKRWMWCAWAACTPRGFRTLVAIILGVMRRPLYKLGIAILLLSWSAVLWGTRAHAQSDGPFEAITWDEPPNDADLLSRGVSPQNINYLWDDESIQDQVDKINSFPEGRRGLFPNQYALRIIKDGWVDGRDNPHDRIIASSLNEDISGEDRTTITVNALNFGMSSGEKIWIQTGDPSVDFLKPDEKIIPAYLTADAAQGDTSLSIDDGNGNPITITASSGDRVLSNTQGPWTKHGEGFIADRWDLYLSKFTNFGGVADFVYIDLEAKIPATQRMTQDPRWDDASKGMDGKSFKQIVEDGPYTLQQIIDSQPGDPANNWNKSNFLGKAVFDASERAIVDVAQNYFPDIKSSDYSQTGVTEANKVIDTDNNIRWNTNVFGTHASHPLYASLRKLATAAEPKLPIKRVNLGRHPYLPVLWQVRYIRAMHRSTGGKVMPWLTHETLIDSFFNLEVRGTPYYEEHIRHMALHTDSDVPVLYFNARGDGGPDKGDDEQDLNFNSVLAGLNSQISADSYTTTTTSQVPWGTRLLKTAIETPNKKLWRITVSRVDPGDSRDITVNVSNGDTITIPGGEVGAWYETSKGATPTFSYTHPPVDNLLPSDDWVDFTSSVWSGSENVQGGQSDPDGGNDAYLVDADPPHRSNDLPLDPGTYTLSFWLKAGSNSTTLRVYNIEDGTNTIWRRATYEGDDSWSQDWVRTYVTFTVPEGKTGVWFQFKGGFSDIFLYQPMLNKGREAGPYASPEAPSPGNQQVSLQKGGNLVSAAIDPTYPDLETVLGDATSSIARIETQDGQVFDPSEGTDEIGTWDPTEAYTIHAESPASFDVEGTVLGAEEVSLDAGWNWLPHLGSTSVPVDQAFDTIQNDLVMVKDETGRVYRPAEGTDQIGSLEPGTAYKILLENPVTLSYPLE